MSNSRSMCFEPSLQAHASGGKAEIEVRNRHPQALEAGLEVGDIEHAAEKRDQQVGLVEFFLNRRPGSGRHPGSGCAVRPWR